MKSISYLILGFFAALSQNVIADTEDWYAYWGLGFSSHQYVEPLDSNINQLESLPGVSRMEIAIDMLGFYWPIDNQSKTIAGFVISGSADRLYDSVDYIQINQYLYGGSVMHFFGKHAGDGLFLRGDLGISKGAISDSFGNSSRSDNGRGYLIGIGYAIPTSSESRLMFSITSSRNTIEDDEYRSIAFRIGGLW